MPPRKKLVIGADVKPAGRLRYCSHNKKGHEIKKGETVLEVQSGMAKKGYCRACAREMVAEAERELASLRQQLDAETSSEPAGSGDEE